MYTIQPKLAILDAPRSRPPAAAAMEPSAFRMQLGSEQCLVWISQLISGGISGVGVGDGFVMVGRIQIEICRSGQKLALRRGEVELRSNFSPFYELYTYVYKS